MQDEGAALDGIRDLVAFDEESRAREKSGAFARRQRRNRRAAVPRRNAVERGDARRASEDEVRGEEIRIAAVRIPDVVSDHVVDFVDHVVVERNVGVGAFGERSERGRVDEAREAIEPEPFAEEAAHGGVRALVREDALDLRLVARVGEQRAVGRGVAELVVGRGCQKWYERREASSWPLGGARPRGGWRALPSISKW